jgi:membrane AbrB-like protein
MDRKRWLAVAGALAVSVAGGSLCAWLRTPLPWMIGPLTAMAIFQFGGSSLEAPRFGREAGQLAIGLALGLYFTPQVAREVLAYWPVLLATAVGVLAIGVASSYFLERAARVDRATALFSCAIGGAAEMVVLAERHGALLDRVALSHSLRLLIVVTTVPVAITLLGQTGTDDYRPVIIPFDAAGLATLAALGFAAALAARRASIPNAFMMGPLLACIALTASGITFSSLPSHFTNAAQLLLACSLGSRFQQSFLREAPRYVASVIATILLMLALCTLLAAGLAWGFGITVPTMLLSASPGGIAEMSITAKVLRAGVAFVTAAHVTRFVIVVLLTDPLFRLIERHR